MKKAFKIFFISVLCTGSAFCILFFTPAYAQSQYVKAEIPQYFELTEKGVRTYKIALSDIVSDTEADGGNPQSWRIDNDKLKKRVTAAVFQTMRVRPKDAYIDPENMEVVHEVEGNLILIDSVVSTVASSISENRFRAVLDDRNYSHPRIRSYDPRIISTLKSFDRLTNRSITIDVANGIKEEIVPAQLKEWITYDGSRFVFDDAAINEFADSLSSRYTTYGTLRSFTTYYGSVVSVGNGYYDNYNGWVADASATRRSVSNAVRGKKETAAVGWSERGYTLDENGDDIGGTYIEISIDNQHLLFFKDHEKIMETDIVSGTETNPERATVRGLFHVLQMKHPYVMHGSYGSQPCDYFIRITWMGHAMHDAPWQASFGGTRYLYSGSHGCINMPYWAVSQLWNELCALDDWQVPIVIY